ncbi:MAG: APC family permease [Francisellaceae bacterium]
MAAIDLSKRKTKVSLFSATLLSATCMVGSGWLFSAQLSAKEAGNWAFLAWILAALLVGAVGMCLSVVVSLYPFSGSTTRSSALSHNNIFGMPFAFANWFGIMVTVATEAQATTQYLSAAVGSNLLIENHALTVTGKLLALLILFLYLVINYYGIKLLARVNNVVTVLKIFTPLFTVIVLAIAAFDHSGHSQNFALQSDKDYGFGSAIMAIIGAGLIYSYNGFQTSVAYASEIENPKRNVPLSILISIGIVMLLYMALQYAFMAAVPHEMLVQNGGWAGLNFSSPLVNLSVLLGINFLMILLLADSVVSPSGTGYAYLGAASRMLYAMAAEGQMPRWIAHLCPVYNFSKRSMLINWVLVALVLWNAKSWASLMVVVTGYHLIGYMAAPVSMGAIAPKTKWAGLIVFTLLGLIMLTIPTHDLLVMNISLTVVIAIYLAIQNKVGIMKLLAFSLPFLVYLWLIYLVPDIWFVGILSVVFYLLITYTPYVAYCKTNNTNEVLETGEMVKA